MLLIKGYIFLLKGRHGDIKLIDPEQLICYQEVSHHKKAIDALVFHPHHPTWLFSMSYHISYAFLYHFFSIILVLSSHLTRHNAIEMMMYRAFILRTYGCIFLIVIRIPPLVLHIYPGFFHSSPFFPLPFP